MLLPLILPLMLRLLVTLPTPLAMGEVVLSMSAGRPESALTFLLKVEHNDGKDAPRSTAGGAVLPLPLPLLLEAALLALAAEPSAPRRMV